MLTKVPSETKSKTEPSQLNTKYFVGVVAVFAVLGIAGGYMMFPLLQAPNVVTVAVNTTNTTNNTTNYTSPVVKHSTIVSNKSVENSQNNSGSTVSKATNKSTSKQTNNNVGSSHTGKNTT